MGILLKLFGTREKVRYTGETVGGGIINGIADIEHFGLTEDELCDHIIDTIFVENDIVVKSLRITGSVKK